MALAGVVITSRSVSWVSLATAAELREITWAERSDMNPSNLAAKNDDGHTRMWDAASNLVKGEHHSRKQAVADRGRNFYGMPKFFAHSTGYVQDYVSQRDGFGLPARKAAPSQLQAAHTQKLLQLPAEGMSESAKAKAYAAVNAWETKELRKSFADPPLSQAAVKKAEASTWAKKARTQQLFNAAHNDEITWSNIGHMHPSEMTELRRMSPEYKAIEKKHHVTAATDMDYQPLRWLHQQGEPNAAQKRKAALKVKPARLQELWNAGADDEVGGSGLGSEDQDKAFLPRQWLASQHDDAEMRETAPLPMPGFKRVFREDADHERNYEGSYVSDNSIGLQVDNLKAPEQMLAMTDAQLYKGAEKEHAKARAAYLKAAYHKRQADMAKEHPQSAKADQLPEEAEAIQATEKQGLRALKKIDELTTSPASVGDDIEAAEKVQAAGRIAYMARHQRIADRATGGLVSKKEKSSSSSKDSGMKKAQATTALEGEEEEEEEADGEEDENAAVKSELDDLRAMAMDAVGNLPETAPASIRSIAKGDYDALMAYLDQVAADTTRLQHGDAVPAGQGEDGGQEAAEKSAPLALKGVKFSSLHKLGGVEVVLALDEAVRSPLDKVATELKGAKNDAERSNIVLQGLANARINALEIVDMPAAAEMAAREDILNAEEAKEATLAKNEMKGIPRYTPDVDMVRAVPVEQVQLLN